MPDKSDPLSPRNTCFLFRLCQVERVRNTLAVTLPAEELQWRGGVPVPSALGIAWTPRQPLSQDVRIRCAPGPAARHDRTHYPPQPRYVSRTVTVSFEGPVSYGRIPTDEGWALRVDAAVASGGPGGEDWGQYDALEFTCPPPAAPARAHMAAASSEAASDEGPINGPHQPFP